MPFTGYVGVPGSAASTHSKLDSFRDRNRGLRPSPRFLPRNNDGPIFSYRGPRTLKIDFNDAEAFDLGQWVA